METNFHQSQNFEAIMACMHPLTTNKVVHVVIVYALPSCSFSDLKQNIATCLLSYDYEPQEEYIVKSIIHDENYNAELENFNSINHLPCLSPYFIIWKHANFTKAHISATTFDNLT
jgi:hypothetical protein